MENKKDTTIVTNNGIRISGDVSAFSLYAQDRGPSVIEDTTETEAKQKEAVRMNNPIKNLLNTPSKERKHVKKEKKTKKNPLPKVKEVKETEAERRRKAAAKKRIEKYHESMAKSKQANSKKPSLSSFEVMQKREWILDWNSVMFKNGYMIIYAHSNSGVKFRPQKMYISGLLESFNYLKKYLNQRLPPIRCEIEKLGLRIIDKINFDEAIQQFAVAARQGAVFVKRNGSNAVSSPSPMSFSQALSKAKQMTPEEFKKYKSMYIDYLVTQQSKKYKVIPCVERLAYSNSDNTEYAFMFSVECVSGKKLIVHENVNPDRSTLLFLVKEADYDKSIREIYDFLQSAEINKRSSLRDKSIEMKNAGIVSYRSINHDDLHSWKSTINAYKNYR